VGEQAFALNKQSYYLALEFIHIVIFFSMIWSVTAASYCLLLHDPICLTTFHCT
jgi:hypothetical protein